MPTMLEISNWYIGFNWLDPVVGKGETPEQEERNRKLRQALSIAIDWEEYIAIFERGQGEPRRGPVPPASSAIASRTFGVNPDRLRGRRRQARAARSRRRRGCWPRPAIPTAATRRPASRWCSTTTTRRADAGRQGAGGLVGKQFAKIGVQLELRATDYNRFQDKIDKGSVQIFFWGWIADYPDAENFLFLLYGPNSKALTKGNGENTANYQNPEFDKLFEEMKFLDDVPGKQQVIDQMMEIVQRDAVWRFGYIPMSAGAPSVGLATASRPRWRNDIGYLRVDPQLRAARSPNGTGRSGGRSRCSCSRWWLRSCRRGPPGGGASAKPRRARWRPARRRDRAAACSTTSSAASAMAC